ncbi:MAG: gliding motility-associated ABC transporter permease subunit GldF [Cyclobacteriaceae bacterium]|jgi:ABC-2 type transport system permease protein|nr:gliding motility-associated ABC transporter permease subunit GldF [Cyclobacteriaceae bacterium]
MTHILFKEFNGFLNSLIAYIVIGVFLTAMGLLLWVFPETSVLEYGYADMGTFFALAPYVYIFLIPAITMRSFAEEKRAGTMELLLTRPLSDWDIILGKYLAGLLLIIFSILPTLIYYFSISYLGDPAGNIDTSGVIGSYIGLVLLGAAFCAIGLFSSSLTTNQIVSFILGAFFCFLLYAGFDSISNLNLWSANVLIIRQLGMNYHYDALGKGLIDSRDLIYFLSLAMLFLLLTKLKIGSRSW